MSDSVIRPHGRRPGPHLPVEVGRRSSVGRIATGAHMIIAANLDVADFSELTGFDDILTGFDQMRRASPLHVYLHDTLVFSCCGQHRLTLDHVCADGLLDVNIGPRLDRGNHRQSVPVVGRRDVHDIKLFPLEHLAIVAIGTWRFFRDLPFGNHLGGLGQHLGIYIA